MRRLWPLMLFALVAAPASAGTTPPRPKLVVAIAVDQFGAALFEQHRSRFTGGLHQLAREGAVFPNGYQSHAATETCPGHSTMLTGFHPAATGIIANSWYDAATGTTRYCVHDPSGPVPGRDGQPRGPANLKVATLGEWMKAADPASRVYAVSGKDRAAIMMAGHNPDGVFWWDDENGFTTSVPAGTTAQARLAPVAAFNDVLRRSWAKTPPAWIVADKACAAMTETRRYGGLTIVHKLPPEEGAPATDGSFDRADPAFRKWFRATPGLDRITMDLATRILDEQRLGRGSAPDLLAISLSATDYVGHRYGNQGPEMCDQLAQLDRMLGVFLDRLAALKVPVLVVLTADHGSLDAAERVAERGIPAVRFDIGAIAEAVNATIKTALGLDFDPLVVDGEQVWISDWVDAAQRGDVETRALGLLRRRPEVEAVFRRSEVLAATPPRGKPADELSLIERYAESTTAERSADLIVVPKPYASIGDPEAPGDAIAGHGSPWNYDRRVPILFWWPGADGFEQSLPIETVDIAPTLAAVAGISAPRIDGRCRDLDRTAADSCVVAGKIMSPPMNIRLR